MTIYQVIGFQKGDAPHWEIAFVEADSPEAAKGILWDKISDEDRRAETVGDPTPPDSWKVEPRDRPLLFVLGGWCR